MQSVHSAVIRREREDGQILISSRSKVDEWMNRWRVNDRKGKGREGILRTVAPFAAECVGIEVLTGAVPLD